MYVCILRPVILASFRDQESRHLEWVVIKVDNTFLGLVFSSKAPKELYPTK